jgi:peptidoglycan hydrolase CwlO-like protein
MDQLTVMYTNLASSQKLLTKDKKVVENKLQRVTDKYRELDSNYKVVREQCSQSQRTIKELYKLIQERLINRPDGDH